MTNKTDPGTVPKSPAQKRALQRAQRNKAALMAEKRRYGFFDDGAGRRYTIGVDLLTAGEYAKARNHYRWFDRTFNDDIGEPGYLLMGIIAELRTGHPKDARLRLRRAMFSNPAMLPALLGREIGAMPKGSSNWERPEHLAYLQGMFQQITDEERAWIATAFDSAEVQKDYRRFLDLEFAIDREPVGEKRGALIDERSLLCWGKLPDFGGVFSTRDAD